MFCLSFFFKKSANRAKALFFDIFYPRYCLGCKQNGFWLCEGCWRSLVRPKAETYFLNFNQPELKISLDCLFSISKYTNKLTLSLIKVFKYNFIPEIGFDLGLLLTWQFVQAIALEQVVLAPSLKRFISQAKFNWPQFISYYFSLPADERYSGQNLFLKHKAIKPPANILLIPVPLHNRRLRWRGFNQAEIIARPLADFFNLKLSLKQLVRQRYTRPQAKLKPQQRWHSLKNSFSWRGKSLVNKTTILIDDVATTGATLNECAYVLKQAGAKKVCALVIGRG